MTGASPGCCFAPNGRLQHTLARLNPPTQDENPAVWVQARLHVPVVSHARPYSTASRPRRVLRPFIVR
jgi:hypothetical protein